MNFLSHLKKDSLVISVVWSILKTKTFLVLSLMLAVFLLPQNPVMASDFSPYLPAPILTTPLENSQLSQLTTITGKTILPARTIVYLDNKNLGYTTIVKEENGYGNFQLNLSALSIGQHNLTLVAKYFDSYHSATTSVDFEIVALDKTPTVLTPVVNQETNFQQPWIVGVTPNNTEVEIYLDEKFSGLAEVKNDPNGTASFKYKPKEKLDPGFHLAKAKIKTLNAEQNFSNEVIFEIRALKQIMKAPGLIKEQGAFIAPVPSPTLLEPKNGAVLKDQAKITIKGVAHNNHYVKIFLDNNLLTEFMPQEDKSGVASFSYSLNQKLSVGLHKIWSTNLNSQNQESGLSNIIKIIILDDQPVFISKPQGEINGLASKNEITLKSSGENEENKIIVPEEKKSTNDKFWYYVLGLAVIIAVANFVFWLFTKNKNKKDASTTKTNNEENKN